MNGRKNINKLFLILMLLFVGYTAQSQKKVHVITKRITKELKSGQKSLIVKGEKATVNISSWVQDYYQVEIRLIAKHPNKEQAEEDLEISKYEMTESNEYYTLKNFFASEKYTKVKSNLSAVYNIKVPKNGSLDITNIYGTINLKNANTRANLNNSFGEINITKTTGFLTIKSYYSDILLSDANSNLKCSAEKSDIEMKSISGTIAVNSNYGKIKVIPGNYLKNLNVTSKRTEVLFESAALEKYNYHLQTKSSKITVPAGLRDKVEKNGEISYMKINTNPNHPLVKIVTTYCEITIKKSLYE